MGSPVLQVLNWPQTLKPSIDHDGHSGAESLTFLHTVHTDTETNVLTFEHKKKKHTI